MNPIVKPQLVLVPGLLNDAELWRDQVEALGSDFDCVVADITQGETLESLGLAVLAVATAPRFALAGFSLGGYVAQQVLRMAPERVERLALVDTSMDADTPERSAQRASVSGAARTPGRFHGFGDAMLKSYLAPNNVASAPIVDRVRSMTMRLGPTVLVRQNAIPRKDGRDVLSGLDIPVLVLCGEHDRITPPRGHSDIAAVVGRAARLCIVPQSGHLSPIETPEAVTDELRAWLMDEGDGR